MGQLPGPIWRRSFRPERLVDFARDVDASEADVVEHPIVETGEFGPAASTYSPEVERSDDASGHIAQPERCPMAGRRGRLYRRRNPCTR